MQLLDSAFRDSTSLHSGKSMAYFTGYFFSINPPPNLYCWQGSIVCHIYELPPFLPACVMFSCHQTSGKSNCPLSVCCPCQDCADCSVLLELAVMSRHSSLFWFSLAHSWFATVVDGNELGPVYPFQLNKLKYEDP